MRQRRSAFFCGCDRRSWLHTSGNCWPMASNARLSSAERGGAAVRFLRVCLSRLWPSWQQALEFVQPRTVIAWQKRRFRDYWRRLSQRGKPGRPTLSKEVVELIRDMWRSNPTWGSPRIVGELSKIGIDVAKSTVEKYRPRVRKPPSPPWRAFLANHVTDIIACDFFTVPTVTCRVLFVFIMLAYERRRIVHFNVTEHPTAQWTTQQIIEASLPYQMYCGLEDTGRNIAGGCYGPGFSTSVIAGTANVRASIPLKSGRVCDFPACSGCSFLGRGRCIPAGACRWMRISRGWCTFAPNGSKAGGGVCGKKSPMYSIATGCCTTISRIWITTPCAACATSIRNTCRPPAFPGGPSPGRPPGNPSDATCPHPARYVQAAHCRGKPCCVPRWERRQRRQRRERRVAAGRRRWGVLRVFWRMPLPRGQR